VQELFLPVSVVLPLIFMDPRWRGFHKIVACLEHFLPVPYGSRSIDAEARALLPMQIVRAPAGCGIGDPALLYRKYFGGLTYDRALIRTRLSGFTITVKRLKHLPGSIAESRLGGPERRRHPFVALDIALASLPPDPRSAGSPRWSAQVVRLSIRAARPYSAEIVLKWQDFRWLTL
jgi:hypothetical protein